MKRARTVKLPRPKGTRATSRASLTITMHPRELQALEKRAADVSMSLTAYVVALLASDAEDLPAGSVKGRRINWLEDNTGATLEKRCGEIVLGLTCLRPHGHDGEHDVSYMRGHLATFVDGKRVPLNGGA